MGRVFRLFTHPLALIFSDFCQQSILVHCWRVYLDGHLFKLQAGVSLVSSVPPPCPRHARATPAPRPLHTQNLQFKITLLKESRGNFQFGVYSRYFLARVSKILLARLG